MAAQSIEFVLRCTPTAPIRNPAERAHGDLPPSASVVYTACHHAARVWVCSHRSALHPSSPSIFSIRHSVTQRASRWTSASRPCILDTVCCTTWSSVSCAMSEEGSSGAERLAREGRDYPSSKHNRKMATFVARPRHRVAQDCARGTALRARHSIGAPGGTG